MLPFDAAVARLSPEAFAREVLHGALGARHVVVGESFRFGHRREGDARRLAALGEGLGFSVRALPPVLERGRAGQQQPGAGRARPGGRARGRGPCSGGRTSWTPPWCGATGGGARSASRPRTSSPRTRSCPRGASTPRGAGCPAGRWRPAVVNLGHRPTFGGEHATVEAHLLDFDGDLYGARVRLEFHERLRGEQRFDGAGGPRRPDPGGRRAGARPAFGARRRGV